MPANHHNRANSKGSGVPSVGHVGQPRQAARRTKNPQAASRGQPHRWAEAPGSGLTVLALASCPSRRTDPQSLPALEAEDVAALEDLLAIMLDIARRATRPNIKRARSTHSRQGRKSK